MAVVVSLGSLVGCSADAPPDPAEEVSRLSTALAAGDLRDVTLAGADAETASAELGAVLEGMGETAYTVAPVNVLPDETDDELAHATLRWEWTLTDRDAWSYDTTVSLRLVDYVWHVDWSPDAVEPSLQDGEHLVVRTPRDEMVRGEVLGNGGVQVMGPKPVFRVGIDKARVDPTQLESSSDYLAGILDLDDPDAYRQRVVAAGPSAFVEALVVRADGSYPLDMSAVAAIPGARAIEDTLDLAPTREFARPILGTVGPVTAERIAESDGALVEGDIAGLSGLQLRYDDRLRGTPGVVVEAASDTGSRELHRVDPIPGTSIQTSLDVGAQLIAEDVLSDVEPASAIVAIRPSDGHVLVAASGPGGGGISTATNGRYPPGSTFKIVSSLTFLRGGLTPTTLVDCPPSIVVNGREFSNYGGYPQAKLGQLPLTDAIANSCNTAVIGQHELVSQAQVADAAAGLGVGQATDLGIPAYVGSVPTDGGVVDHAATMIGQGRVLMSPLAMATVAASVAAGRTVTPVFVVDDPLDGEAPPAVAHPLTPEEGTALQALMRAVVTDGTATFLADIPGPDIGAKTGTAEYGVPDEDGELPTHAWMIAIRGDLAVAVFVEDGDAGSSTAGPLLEEFLRALPPA